MKRKKNKELQILLMDLQRANEELDKTRYCFNHCPNERFEIVNQELTIRRDYVNLLWRKIKELETI